MAEEWRHYWITADRAPGGPLIIPDNTDPAARGTVAQVVVDGAWGIAAPIQAYRSWYGADGYAALHRGIPTPGSAWMSPKYDMTQNMTS